MFVAMWTLLLVSLFALIIGQGRTGRRTRYRLYRMHGFKRVHAWLVAQR